MTSFDTAQPLDPDGVEALLRELRHRLATAGVDGHIHVVGGSALALLFGDDEEVRVTRDIDAVFQPRAEILEAQSSMAKDYHLPKDWLNANAAPFLPHFAVTTPEPGSGVTISIASIDELIAMKLAASRDRDLFDLGILARHAGIDDPRALVDITFAQYGEDSIALNESREDYLVMATQALAMARRRHGAGKRSRQAGGPPASPRARSSSTN